jgi:hypothetical protein
MRTKSQWCLRVVTMVVLQKRKYRSAACKSQEVEGANRTLIIDF